MEELLKELRDLRALFEKEVVTKVKEPLVWQRKWPFWTSKFIDIWLWYVYYIYMLIHYVYTCIVCFVRIHPHVIWNRNIASRHMNSVSLSLSHHISCFSWTKVSPGTGVSNSDYLRICQLSFWTFHHIVCWNQSGDLSSQHASFKAACSGFGLSSWETNVSLSCMHCN